MCRAIYGTNRRRWNKLKYVILVVILYIAIAKFYNGISTVDENSTLTNDVNHDIPLRFGRLLQNFSRADFETNETIAVLVFCATREAAIENHLKQLVKQRPSVKNFPIYVSQDGGLEGVTYVIKKYMTQYSNIHFLQHTPPFPNKRSKAYHNIASHYKWAIDSVLANHSAVIITEDDLDIADDFFSYFQSTRYLLDADPSIWCISAWNDNGGNRLVDNNKPDLLYRTDFFPGLGWMVKSNVWKELSEKWPEAYWDDFMRMPSVRKNRVCIRPEVSRTRHNNRLAGKGSSNGQFKSYLEQIAVPKSPVDFSLIDMDRLIKPHYDRTLRSQIQEAKLVEIDRLLKQEKLDPEFAYKVIFNDPREFRKFAKPATLMIDIRGGLIRTIYNGVVTFMWKEVRIYAVMGKVDLKRPFEEIQADNDIYDEKWDKMSRFLDFEAVICVKYSGKCDPYSAEMKEWIKSKRYTKKVANFGEMIVF
ncbi:unnamed protein product [Bursaphelenchus okinawaensis]|uniref:Alpha-1,3-mannosyl-glycoprotein 2-beta-N-acetylglucosaminyltransferase n=1 Tax=Bursaphelenchus okinawaensis TaxID=465554 RepID=A0A811LQX5_9BILA|nr:unnamed protein product [Bursaphelenchus okinawaensis]CAG9127258.1 unnamed protein product [Bursaphelenchus okinawaensis]